MRTKRPPLRRLLRLAMLPCAGLAAGAAPAAEGPGTAPSCKLVASRPVQPVYPPVSRRRGEQGTVTLRLLVQPDGQVTRIDTLSSPFPRLTEAAQAAAGRIVFESKGCGSPVLVRQDYVFALDDAGGQAASAPGAASGP